MPGGKAARLVVTGLHVHESERRVRSGVMTVSLKDNRAKLRAAVTGPPADSAGRVGRDGADRPGEAGLDR